MSLKKVATSKVHMCQKKLQSGKNCSRKAQEGSKFCWQHKQSGQNSKLKPMPFAKMVYFAIASGKPHGEKGVSRQYIKKYLESNFKIDPEDKTSRNKLSVLIKNGDIVPLPDKPGHFKASRNLKKLRSK